jgi:DNA processing protein
MSDSNQMLRKLRLNNQIVGHAALRNAPDPIRLLSAVAWSILTEPGDEFAGCLRQALGCAEALAMLVNGASRDSWRFALSDAGFFEQVQDRFVDFASTLDESIARWLPRLSMTAVVKALDEAERLDVQIVDEQHEHWPSQLGDLQLATPGLLWVRGQTKALSSAAKSWAVVGCRTPTSYGFDVTTALVQGLAEQEFAVVSGGAFGIDAIAHRSALLVDTPTIAVMAGGVDRLYPRANESLLRQVFDAGAVVSEVALGTAPTKWRFLQRNRIIAALSAGTVVVEAGIRSGAVNTANHAAAIGRYVAAVPGSILSPKSQGTNQLIADSKAILIQSPKDLAELYFGSMTELVVSDAKLSPIETRTLDALGFEVCTLPQICADAGLTSNEAINALHRLLAKGAVFQRDGGFARA